MVKYSVIAQYLSSRMPYFVQLTRLDKPIGIYLLLWPALWGLWLAAEGMPQLHILVIFVLGVIFMRSAGCVINDYADRWLDGHVERTSHRPLAAKKLTAREALYLFIILSLGSFILVLFTNTFTVLLSFVGIIIASIYPYMKRYTYLPQVVLGAAFAWAVPMGFAAQTGQLPSSVWLVYTAVVLWAVVYDTEYAMVDREDDLKIGIKSTAILFGEADRAIIGILQCLVILALYLVGSKFKLSSWYYCSLILSGLLFLYQQFLIRDRSPQSCFKAFLNNHWVGAGIFAGIFLHYVFSTSQ